MSMLITRLSCTIFSEHLVHFILFFIRIFPVDTGCGLDSRYPCYRTRCKCTCNHQRDQYWPMRGQYSDHLLVSAQSPDTLLSAAAVIIPPTLAPGAVRVGQDHQALLLSPVRGGYHSV